MKRLATLTAEQMARVQRMMMQMTGVFLPDNRAQIIAGRLQRRLAHHRTHDVSHYLDIVAQSTSEQRLFIDLLTTHETFFFREADHFKRLQALALAHRHRTPFRVWSAASSTGEEAYSAAMLLQDCLGERPWTILATDISRRVLEVGQQGRYPMQRLQQLPPSYLPRFCDTEGDTLTILPALRRRITWAQLNLSRPFPEVGYFHAIFLRNVLIYFKREAQRSILNRVAAVLRPQGLLMLGATESAMGLCPMLDHSGGTCWRRH